MSDNEINQMYREYRAEKREKRIERRHKNHDIIKYFCDTRSIKHEEISEYQIRINDEIDIYPTNYKFHNLKTGERGHIKNLRGFLRRITNL